MTSLSTLLLLWSCATTPASRPTIAAMASPETAEPALQAHDSAWPDLDVPPWEPAVTALAAEEVALTKQPAVQSPEALALALETLSVRLEAARCASNVGVPELGDAELALWQGRQVLVRQDPRVIAETLTWVRWIDSTLEGYVTRCGA